MSKNFFFLKFSSKFYWNFGKLAWVNCPNFLFLPVIWLNFEANLSGLWKTKFWKFVEIFMKIFVLNICLEFCLAILPKFRLWIRPVKKYECYQKNGFDRRVENSINPK